MTVWTHGYSDVSERVIKTQKKKRKNKHCIHKWKLIENTERINELIRLKIKKKEKTCRLGVESNVQAHATVDKKNKKIQKKYTNKWKRWST